MDPEQLSTIEELHWEWRANWRYRFWYLRWGPRFWVERQMIRFRIWRKERH